MKLKWKDLKYNTYLHDIDMKSIRPARSGETDKLKELEIQAEILRTELKKL